MSKKLLMNNILANNGGGVVKRNLILHLDATNNTREGQSPSISTWHDLSGNNYDLQGTFGVASKNITLKSEGWIDIPKAIDLSKCTVELRGQMLYMYTTLLSITHLYNRPFIQFPQFFTSTTMALFGGEVGTFGESSLGSSFNTYSFTFDNGTYVGYLNGVKVFRGKQTSTAIPYEWLYFNLYNGVYNSVRIYNDVLTAEEIAKNYNDDIEKYL